MTEQLSNNAQTTLNGAIDDNDTTLVVTSATGFPTQGNFRILIAAEGGNTDEICTVTAVSGTTFTITRASEATAGVQTASSHGNGATIAHVLTAGALNALSLPAGFIGCKAIWASGSVPGGGGYQPVPLNGTDVFDTDNFHDPTTNNSRITIPPGLGGPYLIIGSYYSTTAELNYGIIMKNGSPAHSDYGVTGDDTILTVITPLILAAGNYVELGINATTLNTISAASLTVLKLDSGRAGSGVGCRLVEDTAQTISNATFTALTFADADIFDTDGFHDPSSQNSRVTIPAGLGGKYIVSAGVNWAVNTAGIRQLRIRKGGSTYLDPYDQQQNLPSVQIQQHIEVILELAAGEYIEAVGYQDRGGTLDTCGNGATTLSVMRLDSGASNYTGALWGSGTAFPAGPTTNQRFTRTDYGLDFYYDGTRWLTTQLFRTPTGMGDRVAPVPSSSASGCIGRGSLIGTPALDLWIVSLDASLYCGSPSSGSHYWTVDLAGYSAGNSPTIFGSAVTSSLTADTWGAFSTAIGTTAALSSFKEMQVNYTRTGSPGDLYFGLSYSFRLIGT